jgi:glycosyltransferase involved in cell wall biosynthesis
MKRGSLISIIVPAFNEELNVIPFYEALTSAIDRIEARFEIILVDDGSTDDTFRIFTGLALRDPRVWALRFSRNFGSHAALTAGLREARGDAAVMISMDLQDPPDLIRSFLDKWSEGNHVVWGVRASREDPLSKKVYARLFYGLIRKIALPEYPPEGMDFGLIDRKVIQAFNGFHEANRLVPAMIVWAGFQQALIPYHRGARQRGTTKWSFRKRIKAAIDVIVSFSYLPIRFISYAGIVVSLLSFAYAAFLIVRRLFFGLGGTGWPSVMVTVLFLGGIQLIVLGVLGEYIWRTSDQVRGRPLYIVMDRVGSQTEKDHVPVEIGGRRSGA